MQLSRRVECAAEERCVVASAAVSSLRGARATMLYRARATIGATRLMKHSLARARALSEETMAHGNGANGVGEGGGGPRPSMTATRTTICSIVVEEWIVPLMALGADE